MTMQAELASSRSTRRPGLSQPGRFQQALPDGSARPEKCAVPRVGQLGSDATAAI